MTDLYINKLIGVRSWHFNPNQRSFDPNKTQLISSLGCTSNDKHFWDEGVNVSVCRNGGKRAGHEKGKAYKPVRNCFCGIHALDNFSDKTYDHRTYLKSPDNNYKRAGLDRIIGMIKASGKIVVMDWGFRAEKAEIIAFVEAPWYEETTKNYIRKMIERCDYDYLKLEDMQNEEYLNIYAESKNMNLVSDIPEEK